MRGLVFTEWIERVEEQGSPAKADAVLPVARCGRAEALRVVAAWSRHGGWPQAPRARRFGWRPSGRFSARHWRVALRKLHPRPDRPSLEDIGRSPRRLVIRYRLPREMQALTLGLIEGAAAHCGQACGITLQTDPGGAVFQVEYCA